MIPKLNGCWTCGWAHWQFMRDGRKNAKRSGECQWKPVVKLELPWAVTTYGNFQDPQPRISIWSHDGAGCLCWKPVEGDS